MQIIQTPILTLSDAGELQAKKNLLAGPNGSTEFTLSGAVETLLLTLAACGGEISKSVSIDFVFRDHFLSSADEKDADVIRKIGSISALIVMMVFKHINRMKESFDPSEHF